MNRSKRGHASGCSSSSFFGLETAMPKSDLPIRELNSPLARELAEIELLSHDVETAFYEIELWRSNPPRASMTREERAVSISLFRDAIVQFIGCFDKTAEFSLRKEDIYKEPDELEFFQWLQDLRDAFAAHKFGPYRQCVAGVSIEEGERTVRFLRQDFTGYVSHAESDKILDFISMTGTYLALLTLPP
jgi:hypothetical protein